MAKTKSAEPKLTTNIGIDFPHLKKPSMAAGPVKISRLNVAKRKVTVPTKTNQTILYFPKDIKSKAIGTQKIVVTIKTKMVANAKASAVDVESPPKNIKMIKTDKSKSKDPRIRFVNPILAKARGATNFAVNRALKTITPKTKM